MDAFSQKCGSVKMKREKKKQQQVSFCHVALIKKILSFKPILPGLGGCFDLENSCFTTS